MSPRTRTRSRISDRLGVPFSPPAGPPDTLAPYFKGDNVLVDPSFDNFVQMTGGWSHLSRNSGVNDYVLPYLDINCPSYLKYPNDVCLTGSFPTWCQTSGPYVANGLGSDQAWKVSVANPRSGDYSAAWWQYANGDIPPGELCPINPYINAPFSARVEPGDSTTFTAWVSAGSGYAVVDPGSAFTTVRFYNSSFNLLRADVGTSILVGTAYAQISSNAITAPPGSSYVRCCIAFSGLPGNSLAYVDDAALAVL